VSEPNWVGKVRNDTDSGGLRSQVDSLRMLEPWRIEKLHFTSGVLFNNTERKLNDEEDETDHLLGVVPHSRSLKSISIIHTTY
jgi:hypothetical protein